MSTKHAVNRDVVVHVAGQILAGQLAGRRDPAAAAGVGLDRLADLSVRAAIALDAAIPRAEERIADEARVAEEAEAQAAAAEQAAAKAAEQSAEETAAQQKATERAAAKEGDAAAAAEGAARSNRRAVTEGSSRR